MYYMKNAIKILAAIIALNVDCYSAVIVDGDIWRKLVGANKETVHTVKVMYIKGLCDGIGLYTGYPKLLRPNVTHDAIIKAVDKFYEDERNLKIPVAQILAIMSMAGRGVSMEKIEALVEKARTYFSNGGVLILVE